MRPRSERAHNEVLNAASRLFAERGIDGTSMDAIAEESRVSKATIYKHWPDKDALCLEVLARIHGYDEQPAYRHTADLRADLLEVLGREPPEAFADIRSRITPHLVSYGARNPAFGKAWRIQVLEPPRSHLAELLKRAVARGALPRTLNADVAIAMLLGPIFFRHIMKIVERPMPATLVEDVVEAFLRAHAAEGVAAGKVRRPAAARGSRRRRASRSR